MAGHLSRQQAAERLPRVEISPARQMSGGCLLIVIGVGITLPLLAAPRIIPVIAGFAAGIVFYLLLRRPIRASGTISPVIVVLDPHGIVRVFEGLPTITRASRQFLDQRYFPREVLRGIGLMIAGVVLMIVLIVAGVGLAAVGMLLAGFGMAIADLGLGQLRLGWARRASGATMLDSISMVAMLAALLHLGAHTSDIEAGVPAEELIERVSSADIDTRKTARRLADAWRKLQENTFYGGT